MLWGVDKRTFERRAIEAIRHVSKCLPKVRFSFFFEVFVVALTLYLQINILDRWEKWNIRKPSIMLDCMKCPITAPTEDAWEYVVGTNAFGVKYEIGCSLGVPRVCWVSGPWKGAASDKTICTQSGIQQAMCPDERALADKIYRHEREFCICPVSGHRWSLSHNENAYNFLVYSARSTVERLIRRIRNGKFNRAVWPYGLRLHKECMYLQCQLTNWCLMFEPLG